ncbi:MATH and LRR domain-containing protein [Sesbania bispinosa]|nr:MATH and LRR domain-containing protein [Sesbania bispinosa]
MEGREYFINSPYQNNPSKTCKKKVIRPSNVFLIKKRMTNSLPGCLRRRNLGWL